jgi:hypothetical protein
MMCGVAERYTIDRFGIATSAATKGRAMSAKTVQASHVFSQAHFRAYFMGIVKLAFVTPSIMRVAIPLEVLLMIGRLPQRRCCHQGETGPPVQWRGVHEFAPKSLQQILQL